MKQPVLVFISLETSDTFVEEIAIWQVGPRPRDRVR